jgi:uncharacterized protein
MDNVLVVGLSARALAAAARASGYAPLAADLFCDLDTQAIAERAVRIAGDLNRGLEWEPMIEALDHIAKGRFPVGIVCGTGFEDRHALVTRLADRWRLYGNDASRMAQVKHPATLASLCARLGIPHPRWDERARGSSWLAKHVGGAGGLHVQASAASAPGRYWQERVSGEVVSAMLLGAGRRATVLGLSSQWTDPSPAAPHRYGGAVRPADLDQDMERRLADAARRIAEEAGLLGLNSIDFLVDGEVYNLIDVNPRPGATLDIFRPEWGSLFSAHIAACGGALSAEGLRFNGAAAACVVYASRPIASLPVFEWPEWTADRQSPGSSLGAGAPICTVLAEGRSSGEARKLVSERRLAILSALDA